MSPLDWIKSRIRCELLRKKFPTSLIYSGATLDQSSILGEYSVLFRNAVLINSNLGAYSYVQSESVICNAKIGRFCSIAGFVNIGLAKHPTNLVSISPVFYDNSQPLPKFFVDEKFLFESLPTTVIDADVWIGQGALIKAGVNVGVGAVIGAGAIVTKDVPPYTIVAGNPCRPIRLRFPEPIVRRLVDSQWWEFSETKLKKMAPFFTSPESFLSALDQEK
jgi:acetyltransferase-like isoleucine patch superfamily enzyme